MVALAWPIGEALVAAGEAIAAFISANAVPATVATVTVGGTVVGAKALSDARARSKTATKAETATKPCKTCPCKRTVVISRSMSPKAAQHILDAQAAGHPKTLTYSKIGARTRGYLATSPYLTKPGYDRDEYPPKAFLEGGLGASVRYVPSSDNRSAGGQMASQLAGATEGCKVTITVGP